MCLFHKAFAHCSSHSAGVPTHHRGLSSNAPFLKRAADWSAGKMPSKRAAPVIPKLRLVLGDAVAGAEDVELLMGSGLVEKRGVEKKGSSWRLKWTISFYGRIRIGWDLSPIRRLCELPRPTCAPRRPHAGRREDCKRPLRGTRGRDLGCPARSRSSVFATHAPRGPGRVRGEEPGAPVSFRRCPARR